MSRIWAIAVLGHDPGVLTQLVWALCREGHDVVGLEVWTTAIGRSRLDQDLRSPHKPWRRLADAVEPRWFPTPPRAGTLDLHALPRATDLADAVARQTTFAVHVLTGADGGAVADIRGGRDADALQEALYDRVELLARHLPSDVQLVGSVAGGRKTMGAALQAAFTMHAPPDARLAHVLVHPALGYPPSRLRGFRFPGDDSQSRWQDDHPDEAGHPLPPEHLQVELTDVPFPALAGWRHDFDHDDPPTWALVRRLRHRVGGISGRLTFDRIGESWCLEAFDERGVALCRPMRLEKDDGLAMAAVLLTAGGSYTAMVDALHTHPCAGPLVGPIGQDGAAWTARVSAMRRAVSTLRKRTDPLRALGLSDLVFRRDHRGIVAGVEIRWSSAEVAVAG